MLLSVKNHHKVLLRNLRNYIGLLKGFVWEERELNYLVKIEIKEQDG
jgi:hypothetical protein